jgi:hypothetical protein
MIRLMIDRETIRAVITWTSIQLVALALVVARVRLWNTNSPDDHALTIVLCVQVFASSMLVNVLMPNAWAALFVALTTIPFVQLAAIISATPPTLSIRAGAYVVLWLATLWLWSSISRHVVYRAILSAVANCATIGGAIVIYLRREFASPVAVNLKSTALIAFAASVVLVSLAHISRIAARKRQVIHNPC